MVSMKERADIFLGVGATPGFRKMWHSRNSFSSPSCSSVEGGLIDALGDDATTPSGIMRRSSPHAVGGAQGGLLDYLKGDAAPGGVIHRTCCEGGLKVVDVTRSMSTPFRMTVDINMGAWNQDSEAAVKWVDDYLVLEANRLHRDFGVTGRWNRAGWADEEPPYTLTYSFFAEGLWGGVGAVPL